MSKESFKIAKAIKERSRLGIYSTFPQTLCEKLHKLKNTSCENKLFIPKDQYEEEAFTKVLESLRLLWVETYELNNCFEVFKKYVEFEPILFKGLRYRDHFIHQYLVFLTGLPIINEFKSGFENNLSQVTMTTRKMIDIDKTWLLSSTYHDIGYPTEQFENWLKIFFSEFLKVKINPTTIDMSRILSERNYLASLYALSEYAFVVYKKVNPMLRQLDIFKMMMEKFLERNHGIISALILLDNYDSDLNSDSESYKKEILLAQVLPSALAIAMHTPNTWNTNILPRISFEKDPITFLLIYCDTVQEWGRPLIPYSFQQGPSVPLITHYEIGENRVSITLSYDIIEETTLPDGSTSTAFDLKKMQISQLFDKLCSSSVKFEIKLISNDKDYGEKVFRRACRRVKS